MGSPGSPSHGGTAHSMWPAWKTNSRARLKRLRRSRLSGSIGLEITNANSLAGPMGTDASVPLVLLLQSCGPVRDDGEGRVVIGLDLVRNRGNSQKESLSVLGHRDAC